MLFGAAASRTRAARRHTFAGSQSNSVARGSPFRAEKKSRKGLNHQLLATAATVFIKKVLTYSKKAGRQAGRNVQQKHIRRSGLITTIDQPPALDVGRGANDDAKR